MNADTDKIVQWAEYGQHIPLACRNHPTLRWSTKNILCIGARSIFYRSTDQRECDCPLSALYPVAPDSNK